MKPYIRFLTLLAFNRVYDSKTLTLILGSGTGSTRLRTRAVGSNHIKKIVYTKRERTVHSATLYVLTQEGLDYLAEKDGAFRKYILADADIELCPLRVGDRIKKRKEKIARDNVALTVAEVAGAHIPYDNYTTNLYDSYYDDSTEEEEENSKPQERLPFSTFLKETLTERDLSKIGLYKATEKNKGKLEFHSASFIKTVSGDANSFSSSADFLKGRYGGVIDSTKKSVFLFAAPMFGMPWSKWLTQKEWTTYELWKKTHALASTEQLRKTGSCSAIIVDNSTQFKNLYTDVDDAMRSEAEEFGGDFDYCYIIPQDKFGTQHLAWLMEHDDQELTETITESAISSGAYFKNVSVFSKYFPLMDENGTDTALGFLFDAKALLRIEGMARRNEKINFALLCYPWQENYYRAVLPPNVEVTPIAQEE